MHNARNAHVMAVLISSVLLSCLKNAFNENNTQSNMIYFPNIGLKTIMDCNFLG